MKILHVVPSYKPAYVYGGPIESVARLCEGLVQKGHEVAVFTTTANGETELPVKPNQPTLVDGVPVTYFARITKDHTHVSPHLWMHLYKHCGDYDVVHIHSWWNVLVIVAAIICHLRKAKVVISPRGMLSDYIITTTHKRIKRLIHSTIGKRALQQSYFHATSEAEFQECEKLIRGWRGFLIPNILNLPSVEVKKKAHEKFVLLFLSRIHPKKGIEFLLDALTALPKTVLLKIAGSGEEFYLHALREKVAKQNISQQVEWLGWQNKEQKFKQLMEADLFVLTSYNENFANSVVESLHVGTPVLLSEEVGLASFVKEQKLGWTTDLNAKSIAEKIGSIIEDFENRKRIETTGQQVIDKYFSQDYLIQQYVNAYGQVKASRFSR